MVPPRRQEADNMSVVGGVGYEASTEEFDLRRPTVIGAFKDVYKERPIWILGMVLRVRQARGSGAARRVLK